MNARQRRTVRRAKDARRPWGRAVERERRKAKRNKVTFHVCRIETRDGEAQIL